VLLGHPVAHSLSPRFQNAALRHAGIALEYAPLDVPPGDLSAILDHLIAARAAGNVTIPHKQAVHARCGSLTPLARRVGAVNTFWTEDDGSLAGDNTDVGGFAHLLHATIGEGATPSRVALIGAGGGAAAVLAALEELGVPTAIWNRTTERARELAARFPGVIDVAASVAAAVRGADVVVNATSVGLQDDAHPVDLELVESGVAIVDLVYRRGGTPWVRAARARGLVASDGLPMLVEQGALAFERWLGIPAPRDVMRAALA
jgi:shikimate dehydrogenase